MSAEQRALYPGSFDPPTNGHKWVMERISSQYSKGFVSIGINPEKAGRFPVTERIEMLNDIISKFSEQNLSVTTFLGLYQVDYAEMIGADVIIRGMRNSQDFAFENEIKTMNESINPNINTIFLTPPTALQQISSSMVMGLAGFEGWEHEVSRMVPDLVFKKLEKKQNEQDKAAFGRRWKGLWERLGVKEDTSKLFEDIYAKYLQPHRKYHTPTHLKMCFNELDLARKLANEPDVIEAGLWFHDAVYESNKNDVQKHDDEGESAALAEKIITQNLKLPQEFAQKVGKYILATKHNSIPKNHDEKILVDIDLAILGRSTRLFDIYEENIREEYKIYPDEIFIPGRIQVLESFLKRPHLYSTDFFRQKYETQAIKNLNRSIEKLSIAKAS